MAGTKRSRTETVQEAPLEDRKRIESLCAAGKTVDEIALIIGVHSTTMYRELERGGEPYRAEVAQRNV